MVVPSDPPLGRTAFTPRGRQSDAIYFPPDQDLVALGTAGTGKTTMAVLLVRYLADPDCSNHGRVLLVTYNNSLVRYLRHLVPGLNESITVETFGNFARGYLRSPGKMPSRDGILSPSETRSKVVGALIERSEERRVGKGGSTTW